MGWRTIRGWSAWLLRSTIRADRSPPTGPSRRHRELRPTKISVTSVDRLKADPFAFYAQAILGLRRLDPVDADHSAAWKGTAVHEVFEAWLKHDDCDPAQVRLCAPRDLLTSETIHPMLRALVAATADGGDPLDPGAGNREPGARPTAAGCRDKG